MEEVPAKGYVCGPKCKSRYILAILGAVGMGIIYGLKVSLHVAIVAMVNHTAVSKHDHTKQNMNVSQCHFGDVSTSSGPPKEGPFEWNSEVQGLLLSSYFWGYMVAQLPGGRIAELFSARWVFFFAVSINIACMLLSPVLSGLHYGALLALRILMGIGGGVTFPASHVLLAHWAPPAERSVMSSIVYAGTALGTVVFMLLSGTIAKNVSWQAVFYIEGGVSAVWLFLWVFFVQDTPKKQKLISMEERAFIMNSLAGETSDSNGGHPPMPWKAALTSKAFLAILVAHTCSNWGWYLLLIELPQYMKGVLQFEVQKNGFFSSLPFLTMWIFTAIFSKLLDVYRAKGKISTTTARKIATLTACVIPALCLVVLCIVECNRALAVAMMTIAITSIGGMFCGFLSNHIDIAPNYAGTLMAITNTVATIPGIVVPIVTGILTHKDPSIASWRFIFYITIGLYVVEAVVYTLFGSGEVQPWNNVESPHEGQPLQPKST